jgi:chromate transporter
MREAPERRPVGSREIARVFLKIGAMSYGGPAIMGIMDAEIRERRRWLTKAEFVEGLALVNLLPGPVATQLGIFIGHAKGGLVGGIVAGLCFILPAFVLMLGLAAAYAAFGALPGVRGAFYGIGPVVLGTFAVAVFRLGKGVIKGRAQIVIGLAYLVGLAFTPISLVVAMVSAGCIGVAVFHSRRAGLLALAGAAVVSGSLAVVAPDLAGSAMRLWTPPAEARAASPGLWLLGAFFLEVGAFGFGGGLSMLAFIQDQVVDQFGWLTPQAFIDGLALGQVTPGPILMLAAFVGFELAGPAGAAVAAAAIFLPSFLMMLTILPMLQTMRDLGWLKAAMRGVGPAVIAALAVSLCRIAPHAVPDIYTAVLLGLTVGILTVPKRAIGPLPLMAGGGLIGVVRHSSLWERLARLAG